MLLFPTYDARYAATSRCFDKNGSSTSLTRASTAGTACPGPAAASSACEAPHSTDEVSRK